MKIWNIIVCVFFSCNVLGQDQNNNNLITISYGDATELKDIIKQIENSTDYKFYFLKPWLQIKVNEYSFSNSSIHDVLDILFQNTNLNYYIRDNLIFLTQNSIVYDTLPGDFFGIQKKESKENLESFSPVFQNTIQNYKQENIPSIRIGKESLDKTKTSFTLSGYVINTNSKKPIKNLLVVEKSKGLVAKTDVNGYYKLELPRGINLVEISSIQYENIKREVIIYGNGNLDMNTVERIELLDEVVLSNTLGKKVKESNTGTEKIDVEKSKNIPLVLGERDVLKVATTLPGISTAGEGSGGLNVRGGRADQNLMLLDDAVVYNPQHFFGVFSAINPYVLGDVTIYKGSTPSEFGGRLSSVFEMRTLDGNSTDFNGEAAIGPVTGNIKLEIPVVKEKSAFLIGGRIAHANWILNSLDEESLKDSEASFYDIITKYNHKIDQKNELRATAYVSRDNFSISSDSLYVYSNLLGSLRWDHTFNEKNNGSLIFSTSQYKFNIQFDGEANNNFDLGYRISENELKFRFNYFLNSSFSFNYGASSKFYSVNPGFIRPRSPQSDIQSLILEKEKALESAIFLSSKMSITKKILLDFGIRYSIFNALGKSTQRFYEPNQPRNDNTVIEERKFENNEIIKTYGGPELRLSARYLFSPDFSVKASYNSAYQYIHTLSNNTTVSPIDTWKLSDLNIKPQKSEQYSMGIYSNLKDKEYELSIEGFFKETDNLLDFRTGAQLLLQENVETDILQGDGKAYGVEFLLKKNLGKLNGWLGYTYSRSFIKLDSDFIENRINSGVFFPTNFDKPHDVSIVANYRFTKRFSLSSNFVYQTGRPITYPVGVFEFNNSEFTIFSDRNKFRVPDFYRLDIGFNVEGNHKKNKFGHGFWNISVYNVLGRNNPYSVFFVTEEGKVKALQSSIFAIPIPTITYNFKF